MPLWQIFHSPDAFTADDKQEIARQVTAVYATVLPRFYVNVFFHPLPKASYFIGGEPVDDFVRVTVDHIARSFDSDDVRKRFLGACTRILTPYTTDRGLRWELHIDETPFELWTLNGLNPPPPGSPAESRWRAENRTSAWEQNPG